MKYLCMCYVVGLACMAFLNPAALIHGVATAVIVGGFSLLFNHEVSKCSGSS